MKFKAVVLVLFIVIALVVGCAPAETPEEEPEEEPGEENGQQEGQQDTEEPNSDVETTASIVSEESAFLNAISEDGTWIICTLNDLEIDEELVVEGEFYDKGDEDGELYRKIALYAQDEDRNVTDRYTLTAPRMSIKSPNTNIQGGTFVGDVYVEAEGFTITDATIEGNVYFASEEQETSFELADGGEVTGDTEVQDQEQDQELGDQEEQED